jgi:hypothetical protein
LAFTKPHPLQRSIQGDDVSVFTEAEIDYLTSQRHGRLATVGPVG